MLGWFKRKKRPNAVANPQAGDDGFAQSMALGYATNDGILGGIIGGNTAGGLIGDAMNTSETDGSTPASDSGWQQSDGGYDSGSYDSGCSGGFD